jgi:chorismate-pyruvate lyase
VLITSRKLRHYFQEYSISVVTDYPLGDILRNHDATGRISKWAVELGTLNIDFKLCHSHQVAHTSRLHRRVAGESATYSNRATKALGDVL